MYMSTSTSIPMSMPNIINDNEFLFSTLNGQTWSGGFKVHSSLLQEGRSPISTMNVTPNNLKQSGGTGKVSDIFHHLAVPSGLLMREQTGGGNKNKHIPSHDVDKVVSDDIHDHFLKMMELTKKPGNNHTRKARVNRLKKTRKNL